MGSLACQALFGTEESGTRGNSDGLSLEGTCCLHICAIEIVRVIIDALNIIESSKIVT